MFVGAVASFPGWAINVGEITSIMTSAESSLSKEITNTTDAARYISVSVKQLSSPLAGGVEINPVNSGELLSTPANLILPGQAKDVFRFFYKGPVDDIERYYRLQWIDEPVTESAETRANKMAVATASAEIGTILVVAPRKERFEYSRNGDVITNNGNVSFRVIAYGACKDKAHDQGRGCRERYYIMPGTKIQLQFTDISNNRSHIGIWHGKQFITVK
ncbi:CFA/I fimbrial auxiliary subunit (plasmid) [Klebsiella sp. PL-2018]|nr:CFA/I fimbrial auxiliary subunit [Klebsiella sp. PL-2018]QXD01218.1 CFA/I fimbrial auxiliary subunit [Klebsiella sp. PL-2018]